MSSSASFWKDFNRPGSRTGYNGAFGDSFFSDCFDIVDNTTTRRSSSRSSQRIVHEDVASDIPEEKVKPLYRKSHLSRLSSDDIYQVWNTTKDAKCQPLMMILSIFCDLLHNLIIHKYLCFYVKVMLEVSHFAPSDLTVKLLDDKTVLVEGKHGEREDNEGFVKREFVRKYNLPPSVQPSSIECFLSSDGVLVIRGHAEQQRSPSRSTQQDSVIPLFTHGYHEGTSELRAEDKTERIIPITKEDSTMASTNANVMHNKDKERSVSFTEDSSTTSQDLFSKSFSESVSKSVPGVKPIHGGVSWTIPVNNKSPTPAEDPMIISPDPTFSRSNNGKNKTQHHHEGVSVTIPVSSGTTVVEEDPYVVTSGRSSRASRSPINPSSEHGDEPRASTSRDTPTPSPSWNKRIHQHENSSSRRDRHFSSESREDFPFGADLLHRHHHIPLREEILANARRFEQEIEEKFRRPLNFGRDTLFPEFKDIPLTSNEEAYEKSEEKGRNKDGAWEERMEEKFHSHKYAAWSSSSSNNDQQQGGTKGAIAGTSQDHPNNEHRINISSAA
jgi:hypothetical protein